MSVDVGEVRELILAWDDLGATSQVRDGDGWAGRFRDDVEALLEENRRLRLEAGGLTEDGRTVPDLEAEVERWQRVAEDHRLAMVESDRQRDKARAEAGRLREGIRREHRPEPNKITGQQCSTCRHAWGGAFAWPCPTVALLDGREKTT